MPYRCILCEQTFNGRTCPTCGEAFDVYLPSLQEIQQQCQDIRRSWKPSVEKQRGGGNPPASIPEFKVSVRHTRPFLSGE